MKVRDRRHQVHRGALAVAVESKRLLRRVRLYLTPIVPINPISTNVLPMFPASYYLPLPGSTP